ncbi:MAG TPA: hypothetical protein ENI96_00595 [Sedimenticola thiotaurini]|uniref:Uncharacterized protein n=2 Tax=Sedimenticola thiotaurini TaxID=1543721 RepID=A0A831W7V1_9GAMM|nr:hypothetical protein [Sedimenticola thiotaurini]
MERKIALTILGITLVALALAILLPGGRTVSEHPKLPWLIEKDAQGSITVFGVTLGRSTLQEMRDGLQEQGVLNLFVAPGEDELSVEVYFERLFLSGIRGDLVATLEVDRQTLEQMYRRGLRISKLESGARKVKLTRPDEERLRNSRIAHLTYIPQADLDEALLVRRFGKPARRATEASGVVHLLYPDKGLDIAVNPDGREVFQYLPPSRFDRVTAPLEQDPAGRPANGR